MKLTKEESLKVIGGAAISTIINAFTKAAEAIFNLGKQAGSSIRRLIGGSRSYCPVK